MKCHYCQNDFPVDQLRPYGPNSSYVCFPCGTSPQNEATTHAEFKKKLDAATEGDRPAVLTVDGPRALDDIVADNFLGGNRDRTKD